MFLLAGTLPPQTAHPPPLETLWSSPTGLLPLPGPMLIMTSALPCNPNSKILKYAINQSRPEAARKADPGMPSAHANSLAFLATYVSVASAAGVGWGSPAGAALVFGVPALGIFLVRRGCASFCGACWLALVADLRCAWYPLRHYCWHWGQAWSER